VALSLALPSAAAAEHVTIVRDSHGEPHVQARSPAGASYGLAHAMMEDQAAWILQTIATATGRSAELLGPACAPSVQACFTRDQSVHLFRVPESAREKFATLRPDSRARLQAFARGINDYVAGHPDDVPAWAFHVSPEDVLAETEYPFVLRQAAEAAGAAEPEAGGGSDELADALADVRAGLRPAASNGFVVAGSRTASGKSLAEGDPHLPFEGASQWYAAQISYPGTSVQGVTFRGYPGIAIGSNGKVAWTYTANNGNQNESDTYVERLAPGDPNSYVFGGGTRPMELRSVAIKVQTAPGSIRTIDVRFRYTVHGPVISDPPAAIDGSRPAPGPSRAVSATVSEFEQVGIATQVWAQSGADSLAEFRRALNQNQLSGYNILAADAKHVFFSSGGRNGILAPGLPLNRALDGTDPTQTWQGILPFDEVPQASDPPSGYYQNSNNSPWYSAPGQIAKGDVPYYLARADSNGPRSRRLTGLLGAARDVTLDDAGRLGLDTFVEISTSLKALLAQAAAGGGPKVAAGNALIQTWDGRAEMNSRAYPLFATWVRGLDERALGFSLNDPPPPTTTFTRAQISEARRAMMRAYDGMVAQYGTIAVRYGDLHTFTWGSLTAPVNGGDFGPLATLRLTNCRGEPGWDSPVYYHPCHVRGGSSFMFHVDLADPNTMPVTRPVSDTDDPADLHYVDNARDYVADRYRLFPITRKAVRREQTARETLRVPRTRPR
jgi:acyl-homoserine-lactone acylase